MVTKTESEAGTLYKNETAVSQTIFIGKWITIKPGEEYLVTPAEAATLPKKTGHYPRPRSGKR